MDNFRLQELSDEAEIRKLLMRFSRGADRCDLELAKSVYWPDATVNYESFFVGNAMEFVEYAIPMLKEKMDCTMHVLTNMQIDVFGDVACGETYVCVYHRLKSTGKKKEVVFAGRYLDRIERRGTEWRLAERTLVFDWEQNGGDFFSDDIMKKLFSVEKRGRDELSYNLFSNRTLKSREG